MASSFCSPMCTDLNSSAPGRHPDEASSRAMKDDCRHTALHCTESWRSAGVSIASKMRQRKVRRAAARRRTAGARCRDCSLRRAARVVGCITKVSSVMVPKAVLQIRRVDEGRDAFLDGRRDIDAEARA